MKTTRESFSAIQWWVSLVLVIFIGFFLIWSLVEKGIPGSNIPVLSFVVIFLFPGIFSIGFVWFIVKTVKYIRQKLYLPEPLRVRNIGGLMGLTWFIIFELGIISLIRTNYNGYCHLFRIWGGGPEDPQCSFFELLISRQDFFATILLYFSAWFILAPIVMYITGFLIDRYAAKKIKTSQVVN